MGPRQIRTDRHVEALRSPFDALAHWRGAVERATYEERRAERRYMAVDPDNLLVARGLEAEWEKSLRERETAKAELTRREQQQSKALSPDERVRLLALGADLRAAWDASTTSPRDKKELLRAVLEEVIVSVQKQERRAHLTLRWRGGALTDTTLDLPRLRPAIVRTDEDTIALVRRLADSSTRRPKAPRRSRGALRDKAKTRRAPAP
jgi:hypothetical protein